jgi:hypothetical protein
MLIFYNFQFSFLSIPYMDIGENAVSAKMCERILIKHDCNAS